MTINRIWGGHGGLADPAAASAIPDRLLQDTGRITLKREITSGICKYPSLHDHHFDRQRGTDKLPTAAIADSGWAFRAKLSRRRTPSQRDTGPKLAEAKTAVDYSGN